MRNRLHDRGFTLIELLVVITIIAILASISVPVYNSITERAKITKDISNIKQIGLACRTFAIDNEGLYPTGNVAEDTSGATETMVSSSTVAFNELIPDYVNVESIFYLAGAVGKVVPDEDGTLQVNENCYSYVGGLSDSSPGNTPLLADFFQSGTSYNEEHVWWNASKAVVARCDGSAKAERIRKSEDSGSGSGTVLAADKQSDLFSSKPANIGNAGLIPPSATVANP